MSTRSGREAAVPPTRSTRRAQTRSRIVAAARSCFTSAGYASTSLRTIASEAGITHAGLLKHFRNKDALLLAVVEELEDENDRFVREIAESTAPGPRALAELARRNARSAGYTALFSALVGVGAAEGHPAHEAIRRRYDRIESEGVRTVMAEGVARGSVDPSRDSRAELVRLTAAWDGLQLLAHYLPARIDVPRMLEVWLERLRRPVGTAGVGPVVDPASGHAAEASPREDIPGARGFLPRTIAPTEDTAPGYAAGRRRRAEILAGAMDLFARDGYAGTSMREIAAAVGVSKSAIVHHFPSKDALLVGVLEERDRLIDTKATMSAARNELDVLHALPVGAREDMVRTPGLIRLYAVLSCEAVPVSHPAHEYFADRFERVLSDFAGMFRGVQDMGLAPADLDPELEAILFIALWDGLQYRWLYDPEVDIAAHLEAHLADLLPPGEGV